MGVALLETRTGQRQKRMNVLASVTLAFGLVAVCSAHLCLISPHQRGGAMGDLNTAGNSACLQLKGPCGSHAAETPQATIGQTYEIIFQKNLDHWTGRHPGYLDVNLWDSNMHKTQIGRIKDTDTGSKHYYSLTGTLPSSVMNGNYILQVTYVTNNPNAPAEFYQCADVVVKVQ